MITNHISLEGSRRALSNYISHSFLRSLDRRKIEQQQQYTHLHTSSSPSSCSDHPLQQNAIRLRAAQQNSIALSSIIRIANFAYIMAIAIYCYINQNRLQTSST
jgi:hypothetical protein